MPHFSVDLVEEIVASENPWRGNVRLWNRLDIASMAGREKTSHVIRTIENAVKEERVYKYWGHDGTRHAWIYTKQAPMF